MDGVKPIYPPITPITIVYNNIFVHSIIKFTQCNSFAYMQWPVTNSIDEPSQLDVNYSSFIDLDTLCDYKATLLYKKPDYPTWVMYVPLIVSNDTSWVTDYHRNIMWWYQYTGGLVQYCSSATTVTAVSHYKASAIFVSSVKPNILRNIS